MPAIIITGSIDAVAGEAVKRAREASREIMRLTHTALGPSEPMIERLKEIARHGVRLAEAFQVLDVLMANINDLPSGEPSLQGCGEDSN